MDLGVTRAADGLNEHSWNVVGHTYVPKLWSEDTFVWHATLPDGTFVPPHIHPTQDEWIYMIDGELEVEFGDDKHVARNGDTIKMPRGIAHGIFNPLGAHGNLHLRRGAVSQALRPVHRPGRCDRSGRTGPPVRAARGRLPAAARRRLTQTGPSPTDPGHGCPTRAPSRAGEMTRVRTSGSGTPSFRTGSPGKPRNKK